MSWLKNMAEGSGFGFQSGIDDMAMDAEGSTYVTGFIRGATDFDGPLYTGQGGEVDPTHDNMYLVKYDEDGKFVWVRHAPNIYPSTFDVCSYGYGVAVGPADEVYVTGKVGCPTDFDGPLVTGQGGEVEISDSRETEMFIAKYDANGVFQWVRTSSSSIKYGTLGGAAGTGIAVGQDGSFHVFGYFNISLDLDGAGATDQGGEFGTTISQNPFIVKYSAGGSLEWAHTPQGGVDPDGEVVIASSGAVYVGGTFGYNSFLDFDGPTIQGQEGEIYTDSWSPFVAQYSSAGIFQWVRSASGQNSIILNGMDADPNQNIYITGTIEENVDFDGPNMTGEGGEYTSPGITSMYVAKYNEYGTFEWARFGDGSKRGNGYAIAAASSHVFVTGSFEGDIDFDGPSLSGLGNEATALDFFDTFLVKYASDGGTLKSRFGHGPNASIGVDLSKDALGNTVLGGTFSDSFTMEDVNITADSDEPALYMARFSGRATPGPLNLISPLTFYEAEVHEFVHPEDIITDLIDSQGVKMSTENVFFTAITSDEPLTSDGDATIDDITSKGCQSAGLRLELGAKSNGRVYTLHMAVTDDYGVTGTWEAEVHVLPEGMNEAVKDAPVHRVDVCPDGLPHDAVPSITTTDLLWSSSGQYEAVYIDDVVTEVLDSNGKAMDLDDVYISMVSSDEWPGFFVNIYPIGCAGVKLRQIANNSNGRVYTMHLAVTDEFGYTGTAEARVHVTDNGKDVAIDDGVIFSVNICPNGNQTSTGGYQHFEALDAYPNPFNPQTTITISVASRQEVVLQVFDMLGRAVALLHEGELVGNHRFTFDASSFPSGVYMIRAQGERFIQTQRITLVK